MTLRKVQTLDAAIAKAQNSENYGQALQTQFKKILNANVTRPQFSPAETEQIRQVANGSFKGNIPALLGKLGIGADYVAGQIGKQFGDLAGEAAGMVGTNLARSALRKTGQGINDRAAEATALRARALTALGNENGVQDAVTSAGNAPAVRRVINGLDANQSANQQSTTAPPLKMPNGSTYWNPPMNQLTALLKSGATLLQPQNALSGIGQ